MRDIRELSDEELDAIVAGSNPNEILVEPTHLTQSTDREEPSLTQASRAASSNVAMATSG